MLFLCLYHFVSKGATKAATPNCVPQDIVRARYTPSQRVFHNVCSEQAVLFLYLCDLVNKNPPQRLLRLTAFLRVLLEHGILLTNGIS